MQNLANFLECNEIVHRHTIRSQINRNCSDINRPGKCSIGFSSIFFIVPENISGRLVTRPRAELAMRNNIFLASYAELPAV